MNPNKCQAILFSWRREKPLTPLSINGTRLPWQKHVKYLGVTDKKLLWQQHCTQAAKKMGSYIARLTPILRAKNVTSKTKTLLYKTCIRSAGTYACATWATASKDNIRHLTKAENRFIRISCRPEIGQQYAHYLKNLEITPIHSHIIGIAQKEIESIFTNPELKTVFLKFMQYYNKLPAVGRKHFPTDARCLQPP